MHIQTDMEMWSNLRTSC